MEHFVLKYDIIKKNQNSRGFCVKKCAVFLLLQLNTLYIFPRKKISHKVNKRKKKSKTKEIEHIKISCCEISHENPYAEFSQSFGSEYVY